MNRSELDRLIQSQARTALGVPTTPAYVYSERVLRATVRRASAIASYAGCRILYTLKPCGLAAVLRVLAPCVDGFAASSAFEAKLASDLLRSDQTLHCYSPALSIDDMADVLSMVDYLSANSIAQLERALTLDSGGVSIGLRINPEVGFVNDSRYDPCRPHSKLGVPHSTLSGSTGFGGVRNLIKGIHVHNNCESEDLSELALTVHRVFDVPRQLPSLQWVNLGGGYYLGPETDPEPLRAAAGRLTSEYGLTAFIEPGTALVQHSGFLVAEVLDVFKSAGTDVAVLDTSTSHMPEVFEYQYTPSVIGSVEGGEYRTIMAGRTCLAGDILGEYQLTEPARTGRRVAIQDAGSYSQSRAAPFNGVRIPDSYLLTAAGDFELAAAYEYQDFARRNGAIAVATS